MANVKINIDTHDFGGHTIYECPWCHFDSEFQPTLKAHMNGVHENEIFALRVQQEQQLAEQQEVSAVEAAETSEDVPVQIEEHE